jgi:hypothetical protein
MDSARQLACCQLLRKSRVRGVQMMKDNPFFYAAKTESIVCREAALAVERTYAKLDTWAEEYGIDDATKEAAQRNSALRLIGQAMGYDFSAWNDDVSSAARTCCLHDMTCPACTAFAMCAQLGRASVRHHIRMPCVVARCWLELSSHRHAARRRT